MKKLFFKIYQDRKNMNGCFYVERPEKINEQYLMDCCEQSFENNELFPVLEPVMMTEEEFKNLPEFDGF